MKAKIVKSLLSFILAVLIALACAGCGDAEAPAQTEKESSAPETEEQSSKDSEERQEVFSPDEYVLYQNIFYNGYGGDYDGKPVEKEGVFATISDAYNDRLRYYVWGYYDQTKCCDWQWEYVPREGEELPPVGSLVKVTGTFASSEDALDGYWITDAHTELITEYKGPSAELNMYCMSCTLERVQIYNIMYRSDSFADKEFSGYARIASLDKLEDPYYDNSWQIEFTWDGDIPAIGTLVAISGTTKDGKLMIRSMKEI